MSVKKRKICVVVFSRANYGRIRTAMRAIQKHPDLELQLIVGASAILPRYGDIRPLLEKDGFEPDAVIYSLVEGETPLTMAKTTGITIVELSTIFANLNPDAVITVADRFETLSTAVTASYMNIPLAHTQGGEVTGSIDESVRHAVTKLAHIHFPATKKSAENVIRMGERPENVFMVGCPAMDIFHEIDVSQLPDMSQYSGVGDKPDLTKPYVVVMQHPVTTEYGMGTEQIEETIRAVSRLGVSAIWLWPNSDAGSNDVAKGIRVFREENNATGISFFKNFGVKDYARLIANCQCLIGNTSSGLREGAVLGVPTVSVGSRQAGREHAENVIFTDYSADQIYKAARKQIDHGRYEPSGIFGDGKAGEKIADVMATVRFDINKRLTYVDEASVSHGGLKVAG